VGGGPGLVEDHEARPMYADFTRAIDKMRFQNNLSIHKISGLNRWGREGGGGGGGVAP
jgi:hypothetical protein